MLEIYNSLTRKKEPFCPIVPGEVRMYVCGMTVYDFCHLGHGRVLVVFDMIARYLRARGYRVTYVRNITDIDDKIIRRAHENGETIGALTERFIQAMHEDASALGVGPPDAEPRATLFMRQITDMVQTLIDSGHAYVAANRDVYYHVRRFPAYGQLSGKSLEDLRVGARVEADEAKDDPLDFVLWKAAKPGEPSWDSPWGPGRPGWHIECSAMSTACLGHHFDIHGGGLDLQFPHHENEIAQSEAATGEKFVNVWMHNGFVRIDDQKMSKSLGNFFTLREVMKSYDAEVVRYFILASHYHSPLNYSTESLDNAKAALTRLYLTLKDFPAREVPAVVSGASAEEGYSEQFYTAMDDDFNTSVAIAVLFDLAREINRLQAIEPDRAAALAGVLRRLAGILGLLQRDSTIFLQGASAGQLAAEEIESLIKQRLAARRAKNWIEADRVRDELKGHGVILEDAGGITTWRRA
ncbi:MAG: cysteine--tRNA ligase [Acidiferrobacterales bacterium]